MIEAREPTSTEPFSFERAFSEHATALLRLAVLLTGHREVAEDLVQEAFVRTAPKLPGIAPEAVGAYLRQTTLNLWKNRIRRLVLERRVRSRQAADSQVAAGHPVEERDRIRRALHALPPRQRACIVLRYYADLPEAEIAATLGCAPGTVKSQLSKALAHLRTELIDDED